MILITGGAGFIGSELSRRLVAEGMHVIAYDNLSSGSLQLVDDLLGCSNFELITADLADKDRLLDAVRRVEKVYHLAANADIAASLSRPAIDFENTTVATFNLLEAIRIAGGVRRLVFTSGSGVYGDIGEVEGVEYSINLKPLSMYAAAKIAAESMVSVYSHIYEFEALVFRFANVIGGRQTHGVTLDFFRRLMADGSRLQVLGDGFQSKSYIHVDDVLSSIFHAEGGFKGGYDVFNVATGDYVTVREIAALAIKALGCNGTIVEYGATPFGWKGDVPVVRFSTDKLRKLGWRPKNGSREAVERTFAELVEFYRRDLRRESDHAN